MSDEMWALVVSVLSGVLIRVLDHYRPALERRARRHDTTTTGDV